MEVDNKISFIKKVYDFLVNTQNNNLSFDTCYKELIGIQSFLKKDDTTHIYFSKKLSEEYIYTILNKDVPKHSKRFQRKSKNPILIDNLNNFIDLKFFTKSEPSNLTHIKKIENFEKSMQSFNNQIKKEDDLLYKGTNKVLYGNSNHYTEKQKFINKIAYEDEENGYKKKRNEV